MFKIKIALVFFIGMSIVFFNSTFLYAMTIQEKSQLQPLSQLRVFIHFPEYTEEEKLNVALQAKNVLSIYANQTTFYKNEFLSTSSSDPRKPIDDIIASAPGLSVTELHYTLQERFVAESDPHLEYIFPRPYSCFVSSQLFQIAEANVLVNPETNDRTRGVVVSNILDEYINLVPELAQLKVGDHIVEADTYDVFNLRNAPNLDIQVGKTSYFKWPGADYFRAWHLMTYRDHARYRLPEKNTTTYTIHRETTLDGKISLQKLTVTIPWMTMGSVSCLEKAEQDIKKLITTNEQPITLNMDEVQAGANNLATTSFLQGYTQHFAKIGSVGVQASELDLHQTEDDTIQWSIIPYKLESFGYLSLSSMQPSTNVRHALHIISQLLMNELKETTGLIIDVRDNPGGYILYAELLPQLFSRHNIQTHRYRFAQDSINQYIVFEQSLAGPKWQNLYSMSDDTLNFSNSAPITPDKWANDWIGQVYFKPVVVLNNVNCYSACENFTALMDDFANAAILGEASYTGGGGANVVSFSHHLIEQWGLDKVSDFNIKPLPAGQDMHLAWRQALRVTPTGLEQLENIGIQSEIVVTRNIEDVTQGRIPNLTNILNFLQDYTHPQFHVSDWKSCYQTTCQTPSISSSFKGRVDFEHQVFVSKILTDMYFVGYQIPFEVTQTSLIIHVSGITTLKILQNKQEIASFNLSFSENPQSIHLPLNNINTETIVEFTGYHDEHIAWRSIRLIQPKNF